MARWKSPVFGIQKGKLEHDCRCLSSAPSLRVPSYAVGPFLRGAGRARIEWGRGVAGVSGTTPSWPTGLRAQNAGRVSLARMSLILRVVAALIGQSIRVGLDTRAVRKETETKVRFSSGLKAYKEARQYGQV